VRESLVKVVVVKVGEDPVEKILRNSLSAFQQEVHGNIECVSAFPDDSGETRIICREDGKALGLPVNRFLYDNKGKAVDSVCGDFFLVGTYQGKEFCSLTEAAIARCLRQFRLHRETELER
jgi:hypothetical protein